MSRMKALFAAFVVTAAMAALVPSASAVVTSKGQVVVSGSSALWQTIALAAFNNGGCPLAKVKVHPPCQHWTSKDNFNLTDSRPTKVKKNRGGPGTAAVDTGGIWIVWDSGTATARNVWAYIKVDSVVGDRCLFANPVCTITPPTGETWAAGNKISSALWGGDSAVPSDVQTLFTKTVGAVTGVKVNTAGTDIRPEDGAWAQCRVNSAAGNGTPGFGDGLDGLGYNTHNASGTCAQYAVATTNLSQLVGSPIQSGTSTAVANVLAFNISGKDPFTNLAVAATTTISVGASPITFVFSRSSTANAGLNGLTNASSTNLQTVFSGTNCDAHVLDSSIASGTDINVYLREPLSGTMNTTEATVFRRAVETQPSNNVLGSSQETGVGAAKLSNTPCSSGTGARTRGIGTGEVVADVLGSGGTKLDGIAYAFFSFGNVSTIAGSASYGYATLDGNDPIGPIAAFPNQELPKCTFPCSESSVWGGPSFPALRSGNYSAWSTLRLVTLTTNLTNVQDLVSASHVYAVNSTPDYIPASAVPTGCSVSGGTCQDNGMQIWHSHYQQCDGNATSGTCPGADSIGGAANNGTFDSNNNPKTGDAGGDMGGCTEPTPLTATQDVGIIQIGPGNACSAGAVRN
ncbi:MAG TPA: hypothetical protein VMH04_08095 [Candidatus Solibacter sp.]|nr:hypothetical protein [Candidatus Solibacter sp.]